MTEAEMRGLSLFGLSPLAIAYGAKTIETRSWPAPEWILGQRIAIHASKSMPRGGSYGLELWMREEINHDWLVAAGLKEPSDQFESGWIVHPDRVPRGVIVCTAVVQACHPTEVLAPLVSDLDWAHGDFSPGRHGWTLVTVRRMKRPVPCAGALQLWRVPPDVVAQIARHGTQVEPMDSPITSHRPTPRSFSR